MLGIRTADAEPSKQVGLVRTNVHVTRAVEHFADLNAATQETVSSGFDVSDDEIKALSGTRSRRGDVFAEYDRASGAGRRELNHAPVLTIVEVGVQSPPE